MQDWLPNKQKSALLSVSVIREANEYGFYETQIEPKLTLWLANKNLAVGQTIRIQIDASSVSLTRDIPRNSSIRNILPVKVSAIRAYQYENSMNCLVELQVGKVQTIWANVTQWAIDEMQLNVGEKIYAQIKSVSIETTRGKPKN
jgi:molybdate transport system ATP-binding protein